MSREDFYDRVAAYMDVGVKRARALILAQRDANSGLRWRCVPGTVKCTNHPDRPSRVNLDGDELCHQCADAWARAEGQWAAESDARGW